MFGLLRKLSISLSLCFTLLGADSHAQTYAAISVGSKYLCGIIPGSRNQIFTDNSSGNKKVSPKNAIASVNKDISKLQFRIQKLNRISYSLKDKRLSTSEIRTFNNIAATSSSTRSAFPIAHAKRVRAVKRILSEIKAKVKNKRREIAEITNCARGESAALPSASTLFYEQVKLRGLNGFYVATVMYLPKQAASSFWYCIKGPWQTEGEPRLFSNNPCVGGWPSVRSNDCSQLTPSNKYTSIYASRFFLGSNWDANNTYVEAAVTELEQFYAGNIIGRPRKSANDDCKIIR